MKVQIKVPIWDGRKVGIAERNLQGTGTLEVEVLYEDEKGNRVFPHIYTMPIEKAKTYPVRPSEGKVPPLYLIPIADFQIKEENAEQFVVKINGEFKEVVIYR